MHNVRFAGVLSFLVLSFSRQTRRVLLFLPLAKPRSTQQWLYVDKKQPGLAQPALLAFTLAIKAVPSQAGP